MIKRLLLLLCLIATAGSAAWAGVLKQGTFSNGGTWKITDDGELYINATVVPDYLAAGRYNNSYWHAPWYSYKDRVTSLRFSKGIREIGIMAFEGCDKIKTVKFDGGTSNGSVVIKDRAFYDCSSLTNFDFSCVTEVGFAAFYNCDKLQTDILPEVKTIEKAGFGNCRALEALELPKVESIGKSAFQQCSNLDLSLTGDKVVEGLDSLIYFYQCYYDILPWMKDFTIRVPANLYSNYINKYSVHPCPVYQEPTGTWPKLYYGWIKAGGFFQRGHKEGWTFSDPYLTVTASEEVPIPSYASASDAPWYSFRNRIEIASLSTPKIPAGLFKDYNSYLKVAELEECNTIGDNAFNGCTKLWSVKNIENVQTIGAGAFASSGINSPYLTNIKNIGANAFENAPVHWVVLGENLESIGNYAFRNTMQGQDDFVKVLCPAPATAANAFDGVKATRLSVPADLYSTYEGKEPWNRFTPDKTANFPIKGGEYGWKWELSAGGWL
jgi:hypothetical protein